MQVEFTFQTCCECNIVGIQTIVGVVQGSLAGAQGDWQDWEITYTDTERKEVPEEGQLPFMLA